jgi:hypothetical protein
MPFAQTLPNLEVIISMLHSLWVPYVGKSMSLVHVIGFKEDDVKNKKEHGLPPKNCQRVSLKKMF